MRSRSIEAFILMTPRTSLELLHSEDEFQNSIQIQ